MNGPQWTTEITDTTVPGEDQLGIEGAAQGYQQEILPGIITVTEHARYYSFYAWILYRFIFGKDTNRLIDDFKGPYFRHHELALVLAAYSHHMDGQQFSGVIGSGTNNVKVKRFWGTGDDVSLDQNYFQNKEGGLGQYYRTALQAMGIFEEPEHPRWVYRLTDRGKALAEAYQDSISSTRYYQDLVTNGQLTKTNKKEAEEYGKVGCICPEALKTGKDRSLLLDTFFRLSEPQEYKNLHTRRRNSLGVALDLVHQANGQFRREMLRPALYLGEYAPGLKYKNSPELADWVYRWQMVEVRHMFTFGIQCLWASFLLELKSRFRITKADWIKEVQTSLQKFDWDITLKELAEKLCVEAGLQGNFETILLELKHTFGLQTGKDEYSLYLTAQKKRGNISVLFQTGVCTLLQLYMRYASNYRESDLIWLGMATRERIPLNSYFKTMDLAFQSNEWKALDWINWLYQECIFEQHELIALEKLRYQEYDTFKFYFEEGAFHWPTGKKPYQEPIRLAGNRLNNCLTMLVDLGLIQENADGSLSLTSEGDQYRELVIKGIANAD
jgi:predicted transcriptional regulator